MTTATDSMFDLLIRDGSNVLRAVEAVGPNTVIDADTRGLIRIVGNNGHRIDVEWAVRHATRAQRRDDLAVQVTDLGRARLGITS